MCTVLYLPTNRGQNFASLRDESPMRPKALEPIIVDRDGIRYMAPKDGLAGGTWMGANESGHVVILLNGGFKNHIRKDNYTKSRGLIVTELLVSEMPVVEWSVMDLENMEPFTLVVWSENKLFQLVWDGSEKHRLRLDEKVPYIWSSSSLYTMEAQARRKKLFEAWMATEPFIDQHTVLQFFQSYAENENGFIMNRNEQVKTLSYSFLECIENRDSVLHYCDLKAGTSHLQIMKMNSKANNSMEERNYNESI